MSPGKVPKSVIALFCQRNAWCPTEALPLDPTTWPASLMARASLPPPVGRTPRSVIDPWSQRNACPALLPTICPALLIPNAIVSDGPPRLPRSVIVPFCQRNARNDSHVPPQLAPTTCPPSLMAYATLKSSPGRVPRSVIAPFSQRTALVPFCPTA